MPRRKSNEEFMNEVIELVGEEYTFLEKYVRSLTKIKVKHNICNNIYMVTPNDFLNGGKRCPKCTVQKMADRSRMTNEEFINRVKKVTKNDYTFLEKYNGTNNNLKVIHNICGYKYCVSPNNFLNGGKRCPKCANNIKRTNKEFVNEISKLVGEEYTFLDEYINTDTPIKIIHNICGHKYKTSPKEFIHRNSRCPKCNFLNNESFFSKVIKKTLNELNIYFIQEYSIRELGKGKKFDFYIPSLNLLIEYDGSQHFHQKFNDKNGFLSQIKRDQEKNDFIKNSEYTLIRISYKINKNLDIIIKELIKESSTTIEKYNLLLINKNNVVNFNKYYKNANINYFDYIK
ncbi:homing endonuclease [Bacillus phage PBS1]|uniref:Homing endonuclease n=1 Tax=Bacillus phage PBS1 TaxID=2884423 RepID=A0A223LDQ7_BPPB1|nr:HNH endonuclease [Bacillus phage PBS1]ASU00093.1 homing endonuclease [Bacillus phage PBS1]BDE75398.1 hypothetical protein [Bacillus phage PBS1]